MSHLIQEDHQDWPRLVSFLKAFSSPMNVGGPFGCIESFQLYTQFQSLVSQSSSPEKAPLHVFVPNIFFPHPMCPEGSFVMHLSTKHAKQRWQTQRQSPLTCVDLNVSTCVDLNHPRPLVNIYRKWAPMQLPWPCVQRTIRR